MEFPTLYGRPSSGTKIKQWTVCVKETENKTCCIERVHGYVDHKLTTTLKEITSGKNIGKKNETTIKQQAINEATHLWKKQRESGYVENMKTLFEIENVTILPMLAQDYRKRHRDITSNFAIQPKIDGVRMTVTLKDGDIQFLSRTGKKVTADLNHIKKELYDLNILTSEDFYLDGEIFTFDIPFEEICGLFKTSKHTEKQKNKFKLLNYYIFDCFYTDSRSNMTFNERYPKVLDSIPKKAKYIHSVETVIYQKPNKPTQNIVNIHHEKYIQKGYEGVMIRNLDSLYKLNYRSKDLQKYKEFTDQEYKIVSGKEATGEDAGTVVFDCKTNEGEIFSVRPRGTRQLRKYMLDNINKYIGKHLTVRYQNLSEKNVPRFPVGIVIRDYE